MLLNQTKYCRPEVLSKQDQIEGQLQRIDTEEYYVESNFKLKHGNQPHIMSAKKSDGRNSSQGMSTLRHNPLFSMRETLNQSNALAIRNLYAVTADKTQPMLGTYKQFTNNEFCLQFADQQRAKSPMGHKPSIEDEVTPIRTRSPLERDEYRPDSAYFD